MSKGSWGNWTLDTHDGYLVHENGYEINLAECRTPAGLLDWIFQIRPKNWADANEIATLLEAFEDIIEPQASLCSAGVAKSLTREQMTSLVESTQKRRDDLDNFRTVFPKLSDLEDAPDADKRGEVPL